MSSTSVSIAEAGNLAASEQAGRLGRLGGVTVGVPDPEATARFLEEGLSFAIDRTGVTIVASCVGDYGPDGQAAIELTAASELALLEVTWEVPDAFDLAGLEERLRARQLEVLPRPDALAFTDPAGIPMVCAEASSRRRPAPAHDPLRPRRLGHLNLKAPDPGAAASFYCDELGLRLSEQIGDGLYFLRIATEHHNLGLRGGERGDLHHLGFEIEGWNVYQPILDRLAEMGVTVEYGPGRHRPGNNLFVYLRDPSSGLRLELFADMSHIPDSTAHVPRRWEATDRLSKTINRWGPVPPPSFLK
jgi:catechol 2,3-dioxygenase-like lactoylglutathione lyase family enzyme